MRFGIRYFAAVVLLSVGLLSCNKEELGTKQSEVSTEDYVINLEAFANEDLRLAQVLDADDMTKVLDGAFLEEGKDLRIQLAVRRDGNIATQVIRLRKVAGQSKAVYTQLIKVPTGASNTIELSAVVLSELEPRQDPHAPENPVATPETGDTRFMTEEGDMGTTAGVAKVIKATQLYAPEAKAGKKVVHTKLPYLANWTTATLLPGIGGAEKRIAPVKLVFQPSGTLLRLHLKNVTSAPVTITQVQVKTNVFVDQWRYTLGTNDLSGTPIVPTPLSQQSYAWTVPAGTVIPVYQSGMKPKSLFVWVKGAPYSGEAKTTFSVVASQGGFPDVFQSTDVLKPGTMTVPITLSPSKFLGNFDGSGNAGSMSSACTPTDRLAGLPSDGTNNYVKLVSQTGDFVNTYVLDTKDKVLAAQIHHSYDWLMQTYGPGRHSDYYLPSVHELGTIFPSENANPNASSSYPVYAQTIKDVTERVQFGEDAELVEVKSTYKGSGMSAPNKVVYALRFYGYANNTKRTAFRYEFIKLNVGDKPYALKITARHLGPTTGSHTISDIAQESYWTSSPGNTNDVTRTLIALGSKSVYTGTQQAMINNFGTNCSFATSSVHPQQGNSLLVAFSRNDISGYSRNTSQSGFPTILFKKGGC